MGGHRAGLPESATASPVHARTRLRRSAGSAVEPSLARTSFCRARKRGRVRNGLAPGNGQRTGHTPVSRGWRRQEMPAANHNYFNAF